MSENLLTSNAKTKWQVNVEDLFVNELLDLHCHVYQAKDCEDLAPGCRPAIHIYWREYMFGHFACVSVRFRTTKFLFDAWDGDNLFELVEGQKGLCARSIRNH
jgi:hypothetical protein